MAWVRPGPGRPRKYEDADALAEAIDSYFESISYYEDAVDENGDVIMNVRGEPVKRLVYAVPPTKEALELHLGISRWTWNDWKTKEWGRDVCFYAEQKIMAWRTEQTSIRDKTQGLQFLLQNDFAMAAKYELELGKNTLGAMSMADKKSIIDRIREGDFDVKE